VIAQRSIKKDDLVRAAQINDAIAYEYNETAEGVTLIGRQLGINILETAVMGAEHSRNRIIKPPSVAEAQEAITHAFTMGVLIALRAVEVVERG
jgi:hypothetical protein